MNEGMITRMDATAEGATLRVWVDDEFGRHVCTAEVFLDAGRMATLAREVGLHQEKANQYEFDF